MNVILGSTPFAVREGVFGDTQAPFAAAGVKQMAGGRVRLTLTKDFRTKEWRSAGILGPVIEPGKVIKLEWLGRMDIFDLLVCATAWGNGPMGEVDFLEALRGTDQNSEKVYTGGWWPPGALTQQGSKGFMARPFDVHRMTITTTATNITTRIFGVRRNGEEKEVAYFLAPFYAGMTFRCALWVPKGGTFAKVARDRGPLSIDVRGFSVS